MKTRQLSIAVFAALAAGCQNWSMPSLPVIGAYRIDIQQGNVVTQDMVSKLKPGMTRAQVRFVLGTPLVTDIFHNDRWDYIYRFEHAGKLIESRRIIVVFKDDKLLRIEGDVVTAAAKPAAAPAPATPPATGTPSPATTAPAPAPAMPESSPAPAPAAAPAEAAAAPEQK